jgi:hypothetical protein
MTTAAVADTYVTNGGAVVDVPLPDGPFPLPVTGRGLAIPRLRWTAADGTAHTVQALNPDLMLFEDTAAKHRWPGPTVAPFRWLTFLAWAASRRTGLIPQDVTWEVFAATTLQVSNLDTDRPPTADPTPPGPATG